MSLDITDAHRDVPTKSCNTGTNPGRIVASLPIGHGELGRRNAAVDLCDRSRKVMGFLLMKAFMDPNGFPLFLENGLFGKMTPIGQFGDCFISSVEVGYERGSPELIIRLEV